MSIVERLRQLKRLCRQHRGLLGAGFSVVFMAGVIHFLISGHYYLLMTFLVLLLLYFAIEQIR